MAITWLIPLVALAVQLTLALFTAKDAHSRGHNRDKWFVLVFVFGLLALLIYLLTRNDTRVPESERKPKRTSKRVTVAGIYVGLTIVGLILFSVGGTLVSDALYTERPNWDQCDSISVGVSDNEDVSQSDLSDPCVVSESQWNEYKQAESAYEQRILFSLLLGLIVPPAGVFYWRNYKD